jgi:hypothetical protein
MGSFNEWWNQLYGATPEWKVTTRTTTNIPPIWPELPNSGDWQEWVKQYEHWKQQVFATPKAPELPDEFDTWVEEVRKQNRLEELVTAVYKIVMAGKKDGTED